MKITIASFVQVDNDYAMENKGDVVDTFENPHGPPSNAQGTTNAPPTIANRL